MKCPSDWTNMLSPCPTSIKWTLKSCPSEPDAARAWDPGGPEDWERPEEHPPRRRAIAVSKHIISIRICLFCAIISVCLSVS